MTPELNRREFLQAGTAAMAGAVFAGSTIAAESKTREIKKAVNLAMVGEGKTVADKFKLLKELGFDGVELNRPGGSPMKQLLEARDATGLQISNVVDSVHWDKTLSDPNPEVRAKGLKGLESALTDAKELGASSVLLVPAVVNKQVSYADAYKRSQEEIRKAVPLAKKLGVPIAIENVWNNFLLSPVEAARYVDEFKSKSVAFHFDVGNIIHYGWPEHWIRALGKRIVCLHIKEYSRAKSDKQGKWAGFSAELLDGDNDWPAVMKALDEIGYKGWGVAEVGGGDAKRLKDIAERMDKIFAS